jgi:phosphoribosylaminoimidazolecarboxamide formyltransferase/IMP cyclohydrolase
MQDSVQIKSALISVYEKNGLDPIVEKLQALGVKIFSTGGTADYIEKLGAQVTRVESITDYPSILGGRVKTLHPKVFGGILNRRSEENDQKEISEYQIPPIDLVIVDLYPFEETVASGGTQQEIIEKIDIGGIALIRAAAKNHADVVCVAARTEYEALDAILDDQKGVFSLEQRTRFATHAFHVSSHYDSAIFNYFSDGNSALKLSVPFGKQLRYGENPHQKGSFYGNLDQLFEKHHGKALSYNNLLDVDAALQVIEAFEGLEPTFAILKHNNTCGLATRDSLREAYKAALAGDPISAFGGILIANDKIDFTTAELIHELFCEVVIAPNFDADALALLKGKKNRIILQQKTNAYNPKLVRSCLNGYLVQDRDDVVDHEDMLQYATKNKPSESEIEDLLFASKICKQTKSNTIVLAKGKQLLSSGTGQTSRVDALQQAIKKAQTFGLDLQGAVMASDAFFPFPDCVEIAHKAGITAVIQPGGSIKDQLSIDYCNSHGVAMVMTGVRHFKH